MTRLLPILTAALAWPGPRARADDQAVRHWDLGPPAGQPGFAWMDPGQTGVRFTNELRGDQFLTNAVAHNGSGVALGDVDGNGFADLYFCSLTGPNRLFLNRGGWRFDEANPAAAACAEQPSTGAALADLDGDGDLDLLVNGIAAGTRLFLNDGHAGFAVAPDSGLSRWNTATSMALADIDGDGDLDLYCAHYLDVMHLADPTTKFALAQRAGKFEVTAVNGIPTTTPRLRDRFQIFGAGRLRELPEADALYRNDGAGRFTPIQNEPGVFQNERGEPVPPFRDWGLAAMFRDVNGDRAPDLIVCNDNASPSRFWINDGRGRFRLPEPLAIRHLSRSAMGVDFADIDRDGRDDFIIVDMFAREPFRRMAQLVRDYPTAEERADPYGQPRYNRNCLFLARGGGAYWETALHAGVAASDWSWCPIFLDVDLDGYEDLLVSNGFSFDVMDKDSHDRIRGMKLPEPVRKRSRQFHPPWPSAIAAFRNQGGGRFQPAADWGFSRTNVTHGMAAGDLDNDGDLDLAANNLNAVASLYRNDAPAPRIAVRLKGLPPNTRGIGARVTLVAGGLRQSQEMIAGGRYMSSDDPMRVFAAPAGKPLRIEVVWRDGTRTIADSVQGNRLYEIAQAGARPAAPAAEPDRAAPYFADVSGLLNYSHAENHFDDWSRQPLLPRALSREGPAAGFFDLNGDGWEDLILGAARGGAMAVFWNRPGGSFERAPALPPAPLDQAGILGWADARGRSLLVALPNYEMPAQPGALAVYPADLGAPPRVLPLGDGQAGALALADVDLDGDLDLFVGGSARAARYPEAGPSALWLNEDGELRKSDSWSANLAGAGLVQGAAFADLDGDGRPDLALAVEWGPLRIFRNQPGHFVETTEACGLGEFRGLWTSVAAGDFDGDGRPDLAAGNRGRNTEYELFPGPRVRLFHHDWNSDGTNEIIEAGWRDQDWFPVRPRPWLARGLPDLANRFATERAYGAASVARLLGPRFENARFVEANHLESSIFLNRGARFERIDLPREAQLTVGRSVAVADYNGDGREDLFLSQNLFETASDITREDNGFGLWLRGDGSGRFQPVSPEESGVKIPGGQPGAAICDFDHDGRIDLAVTQNNGPAKLYRNQRARPGLRVTLAGASANPDAIGAQLRVRYADGSSGPLRGVSASLAHLSQSAATQVLGLEKEPVSVWVRWPDGTAQTVPLEPGARELRLQRPAAGE